MTAPTTPPVKKADGAKTLYHVLRQNVDGNRYEPVEANVQARNCEEAIRAVAKESGSYVAVPAHSFKPVKVTVATETTVKLG